jgi:hypothetical protein
VQHCASLVSDVNANICVSGIMRCETPTGTGAIMAKRKKASKAQSRAKRRRGNSAKRGEARKVARAARRKPTKRTVTKAKLKRAPVKKAARRIKQPVAPPVETVAVEHPVPEFEEVSKVSPGPDEPEE